MTTVHRYTIKDYEKITYDGFECKIPEDSLNVISILAEKVGAPSYVKTPVFEKRSENKKKNRVNQVSDQEWETIRNFKVTSWDRSNDKPAVIDKIRNILNKLSDTTYDMMLIELKNLIDILKNDNGDLNIVTGMIYDVASSNIFYSKIYAKLYSNLCKDTPEFKLFVIDNFKTFLEDFKTIEIGVPDGDYDEFCRLNQKNEKRRAHSLFYVNLMKEDVLTDYDIIVLIDNLQLLLYEKIVVDGNKECCEEITENIFIISSNCSNELKNTAAFSNILNKLQTISDSNTNVYPSVTNKIIFKHMDILDILIV